MGSLKNLFRGSASAAIDKILQHEGFRHLALGYAEKRLYGEIMRDKPDNSSVPIKAREEKFLTLRNLLCSVDQAIAKGSIAPGVRRGLLKAFIGRVILNENNAIKDFAKRHGHFPPGFLLISPTSTCNLYCSGCYANSLQAAAIHLPYEVLARILREKEDLWGAFFTVISGGEPLLWRSQGKTLLDICREFPDQYFLMYTNGTLIDPNTAARMAEVGNLTPAVSLEGFEKETDERRGRGTFGKIVAAFENLRAAGVPFGVSLTATRKNAEVLLSPEFMDFCFRRQGALYGWIFQYMPVGRHYTLDLLVTPEQRLEMYQRVQRYVKEEKYFLADFWNSGPISLGCFAAGRSGGYFHINWKGDITPCAFFPYSKLNIHDIYRDGGDLNTALFSPFFRDLRAWQDEYGFTQPKGKTGNWIRPCPMRDHHLAALNIIRQHQAQPADPPAAEALGDERFHQGLAEYDWEFDKLSGPIWEKEYLEREASGGDDSGADLPGALPLAEPGTRAGSGTGAEPRIGP